jgi:hypothetical protein
MADDHPSKDTELRNLAIAKAQVDLKILEIKEP